VVLLRGSEEAARAARNAAVLHPRLPRRRRRPHRGHGRSRGAHARGADHRAHLRRLGRACGRVQRDAQDVGDAPRRPGGRAVRGRRRDRPGAGAGQYGDAAAGHGRAEQHRLGERRQPAPGSVPARARAVEPGRALQP
jgi:hypothetical protein